MANRRNFISHLTMAAGAVFINPLISIAGTKADLPLIDAKRTLTIFHTAALDGQWSPLEKPHSLHGYGGLVNLQQKIQSIRNQSLSPLLIQSGNIIGHECSHEECYRFYKTVGELGFDVVIPGTHDLVHGKEFFSGCANNSGLPVSLFQKSAASNGTILPSAVVVKNAMRTGIIYVDTRFIHCADALSKTAQMLKEKQCRMVICIAGGTAETCTKLAASSEAVDVMLTAEELTSLHTTRILHNKKGQEVVLSFAGLKGSLINRMDFTFNEKGEKINMTSAAIFTGEKGESYAGLLKQPALVNI